MEIKPSESIGAEGRPNTSLSETPRHVCVRVCVCMRECISRPKFSACVLGVMLRVCGCQPRGRELTNRNVAAVSYKVGGWLDVGVPWPAGGEEGLYVPTCVSAAAGRQGGRQANLTDVRKVVVADASATESGMIKCIIDPPHEILVWIIEEIASQLVTG